MGWLFWAAGRLCFCEVPTPRGGSSIFSGIICPCMDAQTLWEMEPSCLNSKSTATTQHVVGAHKRSLKEY